VLESVAAAVHLWLGNLRPAFLDSSLAKIDIVQWRGPNERLRAWSGLKSVQGESLPHLIIDVDSPKSKLEVRWRTEPEILPRGSVNYEVRVLAGPEVLASRQVEHSGKGEQKVTFTHEDFEELDASSKLEAYVEVSATGKASVPPEQTEDFIITFGEAPISERVSSGDIVRCVADGLINATSRDEIETFLDQRQKGAQGVADKHGFVTCRLGGNHRAFRVERPRLLQEVEKQWGQQVDASLGRWVIRAVQMAFGPAN